MYFPALQVRKVVYLVLKGSPRGPVTVPIQALALEDRLLVLQRGLSDRVHAVADAAVSLLHKWLVDCCDGDLCALLSQLDVVQHSGAAGTGHMAAAAGLASSVGWWGLASGGAAEELLRVALCCFRCAIGGI